MLIKVLLLVAIAGLVLGFVRWQHGVRLQAGKRLLFVSFLALNVWAVLRPDDLTQVAQLVGVGRGADLLLYALVVAFMFASLNAYLRFRDLGDRFTDLARAVALRDAERVNRARGVLGEPPGGSPPDLSGAPGR